MQNNEFIRYFIRDLSLQMSQVLKGITETTDCTDSTDKNLNNLWNLIIQNLCNLRNLWFQMSFIGLRLCLASFAIFNLHFAIKF